jgi:two-component system response regulator NreC
VAGDAERRYVREVATRLLTVSIALADDHAVVRSGLRMLLESEPGFEVVAEAGALEEIPPLVEEAHPDVLLLDVHMRGGASLDLIPDLARATRVLVLTMQDDPGYARTAMRAGARGYVLKEAEDAELVQAVRTVAAGGTYLDPALGGRVLAEDDGPGRLTEREREVLGLIALGHTNAEMAGQLYLSLRTIETHRANIHRKLGTDSRAELVRHALELGLVKP